MNSHRPFLAVAFAAQFAVSTTFAAWPEAIAPTNTLPPPTGSYELWPPTARVTWAFNLVYEGTNFPCQFDLERLTAGSFSNVVRTVSGKDEVLDFDALMATRVPYMRLGEAEYEKMGLSDQVGHLRVRVAERAVRSNGWFALSVEAFSWTLRGHDDEGNYHDLIHVGLRDSVPSTGWIAITNLAGGETVMQSELVLQTDGAMVILATNRFAPVTGPIHLALRGNALTLQILSVAMVTQDGESRLRIDNAVLGSNWRYGIEYSTNAVAWQDYVWTNFWGQAMTWLPANDFQTWSDRTPATPVKLFRLKAQRFP